MKLGVEHLDLYRMGHGRDEDDEDDEDDDHQVETANGDFAHFGHDHHQQQQSQGRSEFDLWGDYFEDEVRDCVHCNRVVTMIELVVPSVLSAAEHFSC